LGRLYLDGLTADLHPFVQQIPELSAVLEPYDEDEAAAAHHHLFAFNVFPYEALFLEEDGLLGGDATQAVVLAYQKAGYVVDTAVPSPDHLGCESDFLSFLAAAEADAWEDALPQEAKRIQAIQQTFLQDHMLRWGVPCLLAIQEQADPFFTQVATLTLSLLLAHFEALGETAVSPSPNFLPPIQTILAEDTTGFKEIVQHLLTPAFSGIYLSRHSIGQMARQLKLPRGFGNREQMLMNLMRTAVQYENLPQLLNLLRETAVKWQTNYQALSTSYPTSAPFLTPWQNRAKNSQQLLTQISEQT
jgi:TorA maturation chaperone TorD